MNRRRFLELGTASSLGFALACAHDPVGRQAWPTSAAPFPMLTLKGSARERGRAHGEALRGSIHGAMERWKAGLSRPEGTSVDDYLDVFSRATDFATAIGEHAPDLMEEIHGIAEGSNLPSETMFAMQLIDEEWCYATAQQFGEGDVREKCSVIAVAKTAQHPTIVAQNLDVPDLFDGHLALLRHQDPASGLDALVFTSAGCLALNGMNAHGVAVCVNALLTLRSARRGLPVACVIRGALARTSLAEAVRFVEGVPHASGQCYTLGDPGGIACLEASAGRVARALSEARVLAHTNHPLANDDRSALGRWVAEQPEGSVRGMQNSSARLAACGRRLVSLGTDARATIQAALGSHEDVANPVCRHLAPDATFTAASTVFELEAGRPSLFIAPNPPCAGRYHELALGAG